MSRTADHDLRFRFVAWALAGGVSFLLVVMLGRVAQLQLRPSPALREHIEPRVTSRSELPLRGDLMDRRGRLLSATRFGQRVLVDPTLLPASPDEAIVRLASAIGVAPDELGARIVGALEENALRAAAAPAASTRPESVVRSIPKLISSRFAGMGRPPIEEPVDAAVPPPATRGPVRYLPVSDVLSDERVRAVRALKIPGVSLEKQQVREYTGGGEVASIVGKVGYGHAGLMGAELLLNERLQGSKGQINFVRDAYGRPLWIEPGQVRPATPGSDVRLSVDLELQRMAVEELTRGVEAADAAGGRLVMIDTVTGELLAMADVIRPVPDAVTYPWVDAPPRRRGEPRPPEPNVLATPRRYVMLRDDPGRRVHPALARNRCIEDVYEPGSTFKPFVWSAITELGLASPGETFDTEGGIWRTAYGRVVKDVHRADSMTWAQVLVNSSQIGMIKGAERMTFAQLHEVPVRFGFGRTTGVGIDGGGLPGEAAGIVTTMGKWSKYTQTSVATGYEIAVTPVQMVRAFSAFARPGDLAGTLPRLRLSAAAAGEAPGVTYRVLPIRIAEMTRALLRQVATNMESKFAKPPEGGWRYAIFGKSGTAEIPLGKAPPGKKRPRGSSGYYDNQYNSSFIAAGPTEDPRVAIIVVIDDPGPGMVRARRHYGAAVAGPVVRRTLERTLTYLGLPPSPPPPAVETAGVSVDD